MLGVFRRVRPLITATQQVRSYQGHDATGNALSSQACMSEG